MAASFLNHNVGNTVPRCFKHNPTWQPRIQEFINKIRDKLLPKVYVGRFNTLLCTCDDHGHVHPAIASAWEDITDSQLADAVKFIDNFIAQNISNPHVPLLMKVMALLRKDNEVNEENWSGPQPAARSSALKLLYLLQKVLEKQYAILEPRKPKAAEQQKKKEKHELFLTVFLDDYKPELLGQLVGLTGRNIKPFMKQHRCYIRFEIKEIDGVEKVEATIKKTAENISDLEEIVEPLKEFANDTQEIVECYTPPEEPEIPLEEIPIYEAVDQLSDDEIVEEYKKFVEAVPSMSPTADYQDVGDYYYRNPSVRLQALEKKMTTGKQVTAFHEVKMKLAAQNTASNISSLSISQNKKTSSPSAIGAGSSSVNTVQLLQSGTSSGSASKTGGTSQSTASSGAASQSAISPGGNIQSGASASTGASNSMATSENRVDLQGSVDTDPCPTNCVVHDRRWVSTYQYTLTQCYTHIRLPKKFGRPFSQQTCTCEKARPEARLYFVLEEDMIKAFDKCKELIERWPQECRTIMKPLITQLEKYDKSEIWHSLFKFVFYFNSVNSNIMDVFNDGFQLPGQQKAYVPREEKPYIYQAIVPQVMIRPGLPVSFSMAASAQGAAGTSSLSSGGSSSLGLQTDQTNQRKRKRATLKPLSRDEWSDDCYYHGKKKKFAFQCVVNYLHKNARLPVRLNIPFSMAVCVCNEDVKFEEFYETERACRDDCITMKSKLTYWRGDSKASIQPYIALIQDYMDNKNITDGFLKLLYHFNQVYRLDFQYYEDLHKVVNKNRNAKRNQ